MAIRIDTMLITGKRPTKRQMEMIRFYLLGDPGLDDLMAVLD